ncbi:hypothetical protein COLO4_21307 [Corchorus olitorius]|uniref:Uncharacterized protein n=1 Tax=Corchorus olitorius TaxID=93759 RepID=A0A1R3IU58_9ROSI|nr:hypothetical protein COLO4_21307 [Corchorus olitorius]
MYLYDNVVQWDDSAGEEAFNNAKNRFWAEINGLPCDIRLPDPDSYIDEIDWDSEIDPELLLDLEREPEAPDENDKNESVVILGNPLLLNQPYSFIGPTGWGDAEEGAVKENNMSYCIHPTGWGDAEEVAVKENNTPYCIRPTGWGDAEEGAVKENNMSYCIHPTGWGDVEEGAVKENNMSSNWKNKDCGNSWEQYCAPNNDNMKDTGYGNYLNNSWEWNQKGSNYNEWGNNESNHEVRGDWGAWDDMRRKREGAGRYMSRYKTSRFHGDNHQYNRGWRNVRGRQRTNFAYERPSLDSTRWNSVNHCGWAS